jgi:hypothetical protein
MFEWGRHFSSFTTRKLTKRSLIKVWRLLSALYVGRKRVQFIRKLQSSLCSVVVWTLTPDTVLCSRCVNVTMFNRTCSCMKL